MDTSHRRAYREGGIHFLRRGGGGSPKTTTSDLATTADVHQKRGQHKYSLRPCTTLGTEETTFPTTCLHNKVRVSLGERSLGIRGDELPFAFVARETRFERWRLFQVICSSTPVCTRAAPDETSVAVATNREASTVKVHPSCVGRRLLFVVRQGLSVSVCVADLALAKRLTAVEFTGQLLFFPTTSGVRYMRERFLCAHLDSGSGVSYYSMRCRSSPIPCVRGVQKRFLAPEQRAHPFRKCARVHL